MKPWGTFLACASTLGLALGCNSTTPPQDVPASDRAVTDAAVNDRLDAATPEDAVGSDTADDRQLMSDITPADATPDGVADALGGDAASDAGMRRAWSRATCPAANEAPLRDGTGPAGFVCIRVGATPAPAPEGWPSVAGLMSPVVYADGAAAAGGGGTMSSPFASLADAFGALPAAGGSVVARGTFTLAAPLAARGAVTLVGTGPTRGTALTLAHGRAGLSVAGSGNTLAVRGVALRYEGGAASDADVALAARDGAALQVTEVSIEDAANGIVAERARVRAESISVLRPTRIGVLLTGNGQGVFRGLLVRDGALQGVRADGAHIDLRDAMVANQGRQGIQVFGNADATGGMSDCTAATPGGARDCFERVVSVGNTSAALYVENARVVEGRRLALSATRLGPTGDGDGLAVLDGASVAIDAELADDPRNQGRGSELVGNARAGVVVQGTGATVAVRGALIASNGGPGVFLGANAVGRELLASALVGNVGLGVGSTPSASLVSVQCNGIFDTRMGVVVTDRGPLMVGDGLSVSAAAMALDVVANEFTGNARFGAVANEVRGLAARNHGEGNGFSGVARYGTVQLMDDGSNRIGGAAAPPTERPGLVGGL